MKRSSKFIGVSVLIRTAVGHKKTSLQFFLDVSKLLCSALRGLKANGELVQFEDLQNISKSHPYIFIEKREEKLSNNFLISYDREKSIYDKYERKSFVE